MTMNVKKKLVIDYDSLIETFRKEINGMCVYDVGQSEMESDFSRLFDMRGTEEIYVCFAMRGRYLDRGVKQQIEFNKYGTSNALTTVEKDNMILEIRKLERKC